MLSELVNDFNVIDHYRPSNKRVRNANEPINKLPSSAQQAQVPFSRSQTTSYQSQSQPAQSHLTRSTRLDEQVSADLQLASQLLYGWRSTGESPPAWTNQQTAESLSTIDKKTVTYLEQIFGRIDNFHNDPGVAYKDADQGIYQDPNQDYYSSQLQPGYQGEALAMSGVNHAADFGSSTATGFE